MNDTSAIDDQNRVVSLPLLPRRRFLAVTGGKGGVGKSSVAVNLAATFARRGSPTVLVDADLAMADCNLLLGLAPTRSLVDVLDGAPLEEALSSAHGIKLLPALNGSARLANPDERTRRRFVQISTELAQRFDTVIVDTPAGVDELTMTVTARASEVVLVATPDPIALADAYATLKILSTLHGVERAYLVPNNIRIAGQAEELASQLLSLVDAFLTIEIITLPFIPHDPNIPYASASGRPLVLAYPDSPASRAVARVARALDQDIAERAASRAKAPEAGTP